MASRAARTNYPGKVAIRRVIETARALDIDVAGFEVSPDGTIRVMDARMAPAPKPTDLFESLDAVGALG